MAYAADTTENGVATIQGGKTMSKLKILSIITIASVMCAGSAEATIGSLSFARANLYNTQMRAYNAKIGYYQKASYLYSTKMFGLTAKKYGYISLPKISSISLPKISLYGSGTRTTSSSGSVLPTYSTVIKAANASTTSELMSLLKGWGR